MSGEMFFLMTRYEYREIEQWLQQRQQEQQRDKREVEPLLAKQTEYIAASHRYLALQNKRRSLFIVAILSSLSLGLVGFFVINSLRFTCQTISPYLDTISRLQEKEENHEGLALGQAEIAQNILDVKTICARPLRGSIRSGGTR
ncbi:MAG: hypothetical protein F6K11_25470 [Leptolyngbya sp. SIO3F4]|nr:hypothetical protein [Leptolyngbya sp. SIO3F4]